MKSAKEDIKVVVSEVYDKGQAWVEMVVKIPGDMDQTVTFSSVNQFYNCILQMGAYLERRNKDVLGHGDDNEDAYAAEPPADYE